MEHNLKKVSLLKSEKDNKQYLISFKHSSKYWLDIDKFSLKSEKVTDLAIWHQKTLNSIRIISTENEQIINNISKYLCFSALERTIIFIILYIKMYLCIYFSAWWYLTNKLYFWYCRLMAVTPEINCIWYWFLLNIQNLKIIDEIKIQINSHSRIFDS